MRILDDTSFLELIERSRQRWAVTGLTVSHVDLTHGVCEAKGFGHPPSSGEVRDDSIVSICSNTKLFTTVAVGILVQEGKLRWDTLIADALPELKLASSEHMATITIEDMLSYQTGYDSFIEIEGNETSTLGDCVGAWNSLEPLQPHKTKFQYANLPFSAAGHLVSKMAGMPYADFVETRIFEPLGMHDSSFGRPVQGKQAIPPYASLPRTGAIQEMKETFTKQSRDAISGPSGNALSSARDIAKWLEYLLRLYNDELPPGAPSIITR